MSNFASIDEHVAQSYGAIKIAYLIARNIQILPTPPREKKIARRVEADARSKFTSQTLPEDPLLGSWLDLARKMGITNDDELPAQIQLLRRIISGKDIPKINNVVDAANITAAEFKCPVGAFDFDKLQGKVTLRLARAGESMRPLFSSSAIEIPEGEIVYADVDKIFSRYCKDADETKITESTKNIFCVVDGTDQTPTEHVIRARDSLAILLRDVCGNETLVEEGLVIGRERGVENDTLR
jgi:DNA/RNA-binding domain of Phe-tRNA-synthetase-like protein